MLVLVKGEADNIRSISGMAIPDVTFPYDRDYVLKFAEAIGKDGRSRYATFQLGLDTLAPPLYPPWS